MLRADELPALGSQSKAVTASLAAGEEKSRGQKHGEETINADQNEERRRDAKGTLARSHR